MSKRHNVAYVKPEDPSFLRQLKEQAGYKEGPTVDTKRQALGPEAGAGSGSGSEEERDEEQPTVVVLKPGDLTAEEAEQTKRQLEKEADETPADLGARIIFKRPANDAKDKQGAEGEEADKKGAKRAKSRSDGDKVVSQKKKQKNKHLLLSFDDHDEDDDA